MVSHDCRIYTKGEDEKEEVPSLQPPQIISPLISQGC